jgi:tellurite resistance protein
MLELIGIVVIIVAINFGIRLFFKGAQVATAGVKSAVTGQSFDEAMGRMPELDARVVSKNTEEDGSGLEFFSIEIKGRFPIQGSVEAAVAISLLDATDGEDQKRPVLSVIEAFQEARTKAYFDSREIGRVSGDQGFTKWVEVGRVLPLFVQSPYSGERKLKIIIRLIASDAVGELELGYANFDDQSFFWGKVEDLELDQVAKGYSEAFEETKECLALSVKLAMSVAMADGSLDDAEGTVIKQWMTKVVTPYSDNNKEDIKALLNSSMKESFAKMQDGSLTYSELVERFNSIGDDGAKFEAMELCYDVMAADGIADDEEIKVLHRLGDALDLDIQELERLRDLKMMNLSAEVGTENSSLLGIDPDWSDDQIKKHLRAEFKKWNARINNLEPGSDKDHAQKMLDLIGEARNKYD